MENNIERLTIKDIAPYLPYGLQVEYEGILNGKEIKSYDKEFEEEHGDDFFAKNQEYYRPPEKVIGKKIGYIKEVGFFLEYTRYRIGKKGLQTHYNTEKFKPILYPISCLTKTIQHGNESFVPMERLRKLSCWHKEDMKWFEIAMSAFSNSTEELEFRDLPYGVCEKLAEWHINFVGIPEGLYIDKNTLK